MCIYIYTHDIINTISCAGMGAVPAPGLRAPEALPACGRRASGLQGLNKALAPWAHEKGKDLNMSCAYLYTYIHIYMHGICVYVCMHVYVYIYTCECIDICIYTCAYIPTNIHIYTI